jgi:hypothetical protein
VIRKLSGANSSFDHCLTALLLTLLISELLTGISFQLQHLLLLLTAITLFSIPEAVGQQTGRGYRKTSESRIEFQLPIAGKSIISWNSLIPFQLNLSNRKLTIVLQGKGFNRNLLRNWCKRIWWIRSDNHADVFSCYTGLPARVFEVHLISLFFFPFVGQ